MPNQDMVDLSSTKMRPSIVNALTNRYLTEYLGVKSTKKTLNEKLNINAEWDGAFNPSVSVKTSSKIMFGLGNGGFKEPSGEGAYGLMNIVKQVDGVPYLATHTNVNPGEYSEKEDFNLISPIPLHYGEYEADIKDYMLFKPKISSGKTWRLSYLKKCKARISALQAPDTAPNAILTVSCIFGKNDVCAEDEFGNGNENTTNVVDELAIYIGEEVMVKISDRIVNGSYIKKPDVVRVVPIFYCKFPPINVSDIPEEGIEFVIKFNLGESSILDATVEVPGLKVIE